MSNIYLLPDYSFILSIGKGLVSGAERYGHILLFLMLFSSDSPTAPSLV